MLKLAVLVCGLLAFVKDSSPAPACPGCMNGSECQEVGSTWDVTTTNLCITYVCKKVKKNVFQTQVKSAACRHNGQCIKPNKSVDEEYCRKAKCLKVGQAYILNIYQWGCMDVDGTCQKPSKNKFAALIRDTRYEKCQCKSVTNEQGQKSVSLSCIN